MAHILVVDDDASHRTLLCDALQEMGYRTAEAANGREALEFLDEEMPDGVLLDLRMPVMSGWGLLDLLKKSPRTKSLPIIIISAYGFEWEAELVGASGYISKPVDLQNVQETVKRLIGPPPPKTVIH
ncbi:MAG TPA: response regulator [Myxococcaceae bacterium]|jgi:two-component system response regulator (stage 0 sporulation protein F)|nr:response regulator [Myxococcaceae bacterium]